MKDYISKTQMSRVTVSPRQLRQMKMGLKERTKVRERQEKKRREQYFK